MYTIFSFIHSAGSHILLLLICISKSSTSKEKHANLNLPPLMKTKQFRFVSPQDRICDKMTSQNETFFGICFCMTTLNRSQTFIRLYLDIIHIFAHLFYNEAKNTHKCLTLTVIVMAANISYIGISKYLECKTCIL